MFFGRKNLLQKEAFSGSLWSKRSPPLLEVTPSPHVDARHQRLISCEVEFLPRSNILGAADNLIVFSNAHCPGRMLKGLLRNSIFFVAISLFLWLSWLIP